MVFNLLTQPWIPCVTKDSALRRYGIRDLFSNAERILEILHPSPLATIALHRPLLAILYRTQAVNTNKAWAKLWQDGWDGGVIDDYLTEHEAGFGLFSATRPFYQRPDLEGDSSSATPISKLAPELAAGNNKQLFDHSCDDKPQPVSPADAACLLVSIQNWGLGGGKSGGNRPNFLHAPLVGGAACFLKGNNLRETLLLNLVPTSHLRSEPRSFGGDVTQDRCSWEIDPGAMVKDRPPLGVADYYTWQSRYIRLLPDEDGNVSWCIYCQGEGLSSLQKLIDPFHAFRKTKKEELQLVAVKRDQATWRDAASLFDTFEAAIGELPAVAVSVYADLVRNRNVDARNRMPVLVAGMANDKAAVLRWTSDLMVIPKEVLQDRDSVVILRGETQIAEELAKAVSDALYVYAAHHLFGDKVTEDGLGSLSNNEKEDCRALRDRLSMLEQYWSDLELAFSDFMATEFPENTGWRARVRSAATRTFEASISTAETNPRILRSQVSARQVFFRRLHEKLPQERRDNNAA